MKSLTKQLFLLTALLALISRVNAQVGIGLNNPNPKVILDIKSVNKGVLLPRTDANCDMTPYDGSLVYDSISHKFKYCNVSTWLTVNPLNTDVNDNVTAPKSLVVTENLTVNGTAVSIPNATTVNAANATVTANTFVGNGTIPVGGIIMWSGENVPDGWALCDGKIDNGRKTPDLRGRFIVGRSNTDPNNDPNFDNTERNNEDYLYNKPHFGGNSELLLTNDNLPTHQHEKGTLTTSLGGLHQHGYIGYEAVKDGGGEHVKSRLKDGNDADYGGEPSGVHNHAITGLTNFTGGVYHPDSRVYDFSGTTVQFTCDPTLLLEPLNTDMCQCDEMIQNPNVNYVDLIPNPNYFEGNFNCIRKDYNPNYGNVISGRVEYWVVQPIDNRPAYYVLAFIMRVK